MDLFSLLAENLSLSDLTNAVMRYGFPLLALLILGRSVRSLLFFEREPEVWAWLAGPANTRLPVTHWETLLGRSRACDVVLDYPTISRTHAVLTRYDDGSWTISDVGSKGGILVNGKPASMEVVEFGDTISLGGVEFQMLPVTVEGSGGTMTQGYFIKKYGKYFVQVIITAWPDAYPVILNEFEKLQY